MHLELTDAEAMCLIAASWPEGDRRRGFGFTLEYVPRTESWTMHSDCDPCEVLTFHEYLANTETLESASLALAGYYAKDMGESVDFALLRLETLGDEAFELTHWI